MIYCELHRFVEDEQGFPQYMCAKSLQDLHSVMGICDYVYYFYDNRTIYYKDRYGHRHQYSKEDIVLIKLRAKCV